EKISPAAIYCSTGVNPVAFSVVRPTEAGWNSALESMITANRNSFQAEKNDTTATATRPGAESGRTIFHSTLISVQPSTTAASRTSDGTVSKTPFRSQMQIGSANAVSTSESAGKLSSIFSRR